MKSKINLADLCGPNISVRTRDLAAYTAANMVRVSVHVGRNRGAIQLPMKQLGMKPEKLSSDGRSFYADHLSGSSLVFVPKEEEKNLGRLEASLRRTVAQSEVCEGLIPVAAYPKLKKRFEEIRDEYFTARDGIISNWDKIADDFINGAKEMLAGVRMRQRLREQILKTIQTEIPTRGEYRDSFYMNLDVVAFPATAVPEGLDESIAADVEASWGDNVVRTAVTAIETTVGKGWSLLGQAVKSYEQRNTIAAKTLDAIARYADDLKWKNVFQNPLLSDLSNKLQMLDQVEEMEDKEEILESALLDTWAYAKDHDLNLEQLADPFGPAALDTMLAVRNTGRKVS